MAELIAISKNIAEMYDKIIGVRTLMIKAREDLDDLHLIAVDRALINMVGAIISII